MLRNLLFEHPCPWLLRSSRVGPQAFHRRGGSQMSGFLTLSLVCPELLILRMCLSHVTRLLPRGTHAWTFLQMQHRMAPGVWRLPSRSGPELGPVHIPGAAVSTLGQCSSPRSSPGVSDLTAPFPRLVFISCALSNANLHLGVKNK